MPVTTADPNVIASGLVLDDVLGAIRDFEVGVEHDFGPSTTYDLLHDGKQYPPKAIYGLAARRIAGRPLKPGEFSGGEQSQCFAVLRHLGFTIVPKPQADATPGRRRRIWAISLGEQGSFFRKFYEEGIIGIGWNDLGDLSRFRDKDEVLEALVATYDPGGHPTNDALTNYAFVKLMQPGDLAVAKVGRSRVLGICRIDSPYIHDATREDYHSIRRVAWLSDAPLELAPAAHVPIKALTDASESKHPEFAKAVLQFYGLAPAIDEGDQQRFEELLTFKTTFNQDPVASLIIALRHHRAEELRQLLLDNEALNVATFNRDVWPMESATLLDSQPITGEFWSDGLEGGRAEELQSALHAGRLELHGNYNWGSATRVYGPMISDDVEKQSNLTQAMEYLHDSALTPIEKAKAIQGVKGFGPNIATGLVMIVHPSEFAIYNKPSKEAVQELGYPVGTLEEFQESIAQCRTRLGFDDFIGLDTFLYRRPESSFEVVPQPRHFWWVNQGNSYKRERDGSYLWAPLVDKTGHEHSHHSSMASLERHDLVIHYAKKHIRAIGRVSEAARESARPGADASDPARIGRFARVRYKELEEPIALEEVPHNVREQEEGPFDRFGAIKQGYLYPLTDTFCTQLFSRFSERLPSVPGMQVRTKQFWLFQCNLSDWSFTEHLEELKLLHKDTWTVTRFADSIRAGDEVLIWEAGPDAGVVATAEIVSAPTLQPKPAFRGAEPGDKEHRATIRYTRFLEPRIPKLELAGHAVLGDLQVIRAPQGTNFRVTPEQWQSLLDFLADRDLEITEDYEEPAFDDIEAAIHAAGLRISRDMLLRFHLSLKTRRFVILSGVSGTGKTWLAEEYGRAVKAEQCLVPVAPNWNTNEDLLGFYNPLDNRYTDTAFSLFLRRAERANRQAKDAGIRPRPFHLILDEMNLARVEYYFAKFLSAMERRGKAADPVLDLGGGHTVTLPPNLYFVGTVNVDETTHAFADKVYDRAQLIELQASRSAMAEHLGDVVYASRVLKIWDAVHTVAPFAFRVLDELRAYIDEAAEHGLSWQEALDVQVLQKVLPKFRGTEPAVGDALKQLIGVLGTEFPLSHAKALRMQQDYAAHGFVSYF